MESRVIVTVPGFPSLDDGVGSELPLIEEELVAGASVNDEEDDATGDSFAEEIAGSSAIGPFVNIVYILGLNEKKEIYYVLTHYVER